MVFIVENIVKLAAIAVIHFYLRREVGLFNFRMAYD